MINTYLCPVNTNVLNGQQFQVKLCYISNYPNEIGISNVPIKFTVNGGIYFRNTSSSGIASLNINQQSTGLLKIKYSFAGNTNYKASSNEITINVYSGNAYFVPHSLNVDKTTKFEVTLYGTNGVKLPYRDVYFRINGVNYVRPSDGNGIAGLTINLNSASYQINYWINDGTYSSNNNSKILTVNPLKSVCFTPINLKIAQHSKFKAKLTTSDGMPIGGANVTITINGVPYHKITDDFGIAEVNIGMTPRTTSLALSYTAPTLSNLYSVSITGKQIIIYSQSNIGYSMSLASKFVTKGSYVAITLKNSNGNVLTNKAVNFFINTVAYTRNTDSQGVVKLNINLIQGLYSLSASYADNSGEVGLYNLIYVNDSIKLNNVAGNINPADYIYVVSDYNSYDNVEFISLAYNIVANCNNDLEKAVAIHNFVYCINYNEYANGLFNAFESLSNFFGNCYDQTNLAMSLSKIVNLPTRSVGGSSTNPNSGDHMWLEFYIDGYWITSDPTNTKELGQWSQAYNGEYYTNYVYSCALGKYIFSA